MRFSGAMIDHAASILLSAKGDITHRDENGLGQVCKDCVTARLKDEWNGKIRRPITASQWEALGGLALQSVWANEDIENDGATLFVEDAEGLIRLVDKWWIDRGIDYPKGLKSAVKHVFPDTIQELEILNAERAKAGLPPTSMEDMRAYGLALARQFGLMPPLEQVYRERRVHLDFRRPQ